MLEFLERGGVIRGSMFEMINLIFDISCINITLQFVNGFAVKPCWRLRLIVPYVKFFCALLMKFRRHHGGILCSLLAVMTGLSQYCSGFPRECIETSHNDNLPCVDLRF